MTKTVYFDTGWWWVNDGPGGTVYVSLTIGPDAAGRGTWCEMPPANARRFARAILREARRQTWRARRRRVFR